MTSYPHLLGHDVHRSVSSLMLEAERYLEVESQMHSAVLLPVLAIETLALPLDLELNESKLKKWIQKKRSHLQ